MVLILAAWLILLLPFQAAADAIRVATAADLTFAFRELADRFQVETGHTVRLIVGSSGQLAMQIAQGAPIDVFAAADTSYLATLVDKGLVAQEAIRVYAVGRLALITNRRFAAPPIGLQDLLQPRIKRIAIANPLHAPYGRAAREALQASGLWEPLKGKLVYGENVRQVLQFVQTGNAEAGMVALSVAQVPEVQHLVLDSGLHSPLLQAMAVIKTSSARAAARQFVAFVTGRQGGAVLQRYGFALSDQR